MKKLFVVSALAFTAVAGAATVVQGEDAPPPWAYGFATPVPPGTPPAAPNPAQALDNTTLHTLPGSKVSFTRAQIANRYGPADWFPEDHPIMPDIVARGRETAQPKILCLRFVSLPQRKGSSGECQHHGSHIRIFRAADDGFPERRQEDLRSEKSQYRLNDRVCESNDGRRNQVSCRILYSDSRHPVDQGGGDCDRTEDQSPKRDVPDA